MNGALRALVVDVVEQRVVQPAHGPQPEPHREDRRVGVQPGAGRADRTGVLGARLERGVAPRRVEIGPEHLDAVTDASRTIVCGE